MLFSRFLLLAFQATIALCNTEKVIFFGPQGLQVPTAHPNLEDLHIDSLTPQQSTLRTHLRVEFPTESKKHGLATWVLLERLQEGQRYEVRVCWAATQPTAFRLDVYELQSVFGEPELVTSLAEYSATRQPDPAAADAQKIQVSEELRKPASAEENSSTLFLQIFAAADYYTMDQKLMKNVPLVYVDIILDPYLLNIFPQSLIPTAIYITVLAIGAWFLSMRLSTKVLNLQEQDSDAEKKES